MGLPSLTEILKMIDVFLQLKKQIEDGIAGIKDTAMRKKIEKAYKNHDLAALRKLILGRDN